MEISKTGALAFVDTFTGPGGQIWMWSNDSTTEAEYWNTFVALHTIARALEMGALPKEKTTLWLETFLERWGRQGWFSAYFDDMDWAIEALVKTADVVPGNNQTAGALQLLSAMVLNAWDDSC